MGGIGLEGGYSVGGAMMRKIVSSERVGELRTFKEMFIESGAKIPTDPLSIYDRWARDCVAFVALEAMNIDMIFPDGKLPAQEQVVEYLRSLPGNSGLMYEVAYGCGIKDPRLDVIMTVTGRDGKGKVVVNWHGMPPMEGDTRFSRDGKVNLLQEYGLLADGRIVNTRTGRIIPDGEALVGLVDEGLPVEWESMDPGKKMILASRMMLNCIRGNGHINKGIGGNEVVDYYTPIAGLVEGLGHNVARRVESGEIPIYMVSEFRNNMIVAFMMNPELFMNMMNDFKLDFLPNFPKRGSKRVFNRIGYGIPKNITEMHQRVKVALGSHYDASLSLVGNVARMYEVGLVEDVQYC